MSAAHGHVLFQEYVLFKTMPTFDYSVRTPYCDSGDNFCQLVKADQDELRKDFADNPQSGDVIVVFAVI